MNRALGANMSDTAELIEAARAILPFLEASTDSHNELKKADTMPLMEAVAYLMKIQPQYDEAPAQQLRREAGEMEARDIAIERFRAAVAAFEEG
jgi:hypothetical protein